MTEFIACKEDDVPESAIVIDKYQVGATGKAREYIIKCPHCGEKVLKPYLKLNFMPCCGSLTDNYKLQLSSVLQAQGLHKIFVEAERLFLKSEYTAALRSAVIAIENFIKAKVNRKDLFGIALISYAFDSKDEGLPPITINSYKSKVEKNEQQGFSYLVKGLMMSIRNPTLHNVSHIYVAHVLATLLQCNYIVDIIENGSILHSRSSCINPIKHAEFLHSETGMPIVFLENNEDEVKSCLECPDWFE